MNSSCHVQAAGQICQKQHGVRCCNTGRRQDAYLSAPCGLPAACASAAGREMPPAPRRDVRGTSMIRFGFVGKELEP